MSILLRMTWQTQQLQYLPTWGRHIEMFSPFMNTLSQIVTHLHNLQIRLALLRRQWFKPRLTCSFFSLSLKMKRLWWLKKKSRELTQWMNTVWWAIKTISTFVCLPLADACCAMPQQFVLEPRVFACCFVFRARIGIRKQQSWGASWFSFTACLFNLLGYYVRYGKNKARNRL